MFISKENWFREKKKLNRSQTHFNAKLKNENESIIYRKLSAFSLFLKKRQLQINLTLKAIFKAIRYKE